MAKTLVKANQELARMRATATMEDHAVARTREILGPFVNETVMADQITRTRHTVKANLKRRKAAR